MHIKTIFEISKARNGEYKLTPKSCNGKILFKETYKNKHSLNRILKNFIENVRYGMIRIIEK